MICPKQMLTALSTISDWNDVERPSKRGFSLEHTMILMALWEYPGSRRTALQSRAGQSGTNWRTFTTRVDQLIESNYVESVPDASQHYRLTNYGEMFVKDVLGF